MWKVPDLGEDVLDDETLNLCFELHVELVQFDDGTQRSAEPAANGTPLGIVRYPFLCYSLSKSMRKF